MKKVLILAIALIGFGALAQEKKTTKRSELSNEQHATLQTKRMTLALDLNTDQQAKVKALLLEQSKLRKAQMEERKAIKESGEATKPSSEERYAMQNKKLDQQIAHKAEMKKILSAEQYERWEKMAKRKGKKRGKGKRRNGKEHGRGQ